MYDKIVIQNRKKKHEIQRNLCIYLHLKDGIEMEFTAR